MCVCVCVCVCLKPVFVVHCTKFAISLTKTLDNRMIDER